MPNQYETILWGGFFEGHLDYRVVSDEAGTNRQMPALYCSEREAKRLYEDVRRMGVETTES
jgi:hypothetical protein